METIRTFLKPVIDLKGTGAQIKRLRKISGYSVHDLQKYSALIIRRQSTPGSRVRIFLQSIIFLSFLNFLV